MIRNRLDRISDFETFYSESLEIFNGFNRQDLRVTEFENTYKLNVCPGSRIGLTNTRVVEIFWGTRPFETIVSGHKWEALIEYGATLFYERYDSGHIVILLYPAYTDNKKQLESCIILKRRIDPKKLKQKRFLRNNWNYLVAYMAVTSLDGDPNLWQRIRIMYIRNFKHQIVDGKWRQTKFSSYLQKTINFVLSIGLSGFLIYIITLCLDSDKNRNSDLQMNILNNSINEISTKLDPIVNSQSAYKTLPDLIDSINYNSSHILKKLDAKHNEKGK